MADPRNDLPPETVNDEQVDKDAQAQTVAAQAKGRSPSSFGLDEDSEKAIGSITSDGDGKEDLVDHIKQMDRGGIDMSAYRGEETMDDLENRYGRAGVPDAEFGSDDVMWVPAGNR